MSEDLLDLLAGSRFAFIGQLFANLGAAKAADRKASLATQVPFY